MNTQLKTLKGITILLHLIISTAIAQSKAHDYSRYSIIDPTYNPVAASPKSNLSKSATMWLYGASELECWRLQLLQERKDTAGLNVGYPGSFHKPYPHASFRLIPEHSSSLNNIRFRTTGAGKLYINGELVGSFVSGDAIQTIRIKKKTTITEIEFDIEAKELPALLITSPELQPFQNKWQWKAEDHDWEPAFLHAQTVENIPPHLLEDPLVVLKPGRVNDNLYDFGKELLGYIKIKSKEEPFIHVGESEKEARDLNNKKREQSYDMIKVSKTLWRSKTPVAFRYLYVENKQPEDISCEAIFRPASYKGAFACSDSTLTRIWMNSAYTLRLCMHDFLLDGIKRDRLPWAGDLAMSLLVNAHSFADQELARRTLVALGRAGIKENDINGIIDYSAWWVISQDQYQLYFDDPEHLSREWGKIKEVLKNLAARCDTNGFLIKRKNDWLFIDWAKQEKWTALQVLWWWAQTSGVKLAQRMGDKETADYWTKSAATLKSNLTKTVWDSNAQIWRSNINSQSVTTRHPNFFAILSGLTPASGGQGIKVMLENSNVQAVGTPYMAGFEVMALAELGNTDYMLKHVKDYWGGMLDKDATTFWEAYNPSDSYSRQYVFYNRPYGKSLCHAWSSGPAAFLPSALLGLKPLEDGWRRFSLQPNLGSLKSANVCVPTKFGNITADIINKSIRVNIPTGTALEWKGKLIEGPRVWTDTL